MTTPPRISIVTSSYNQGAFIGRTIESIRTQAYPNLEHIVVDGMSTDATADVLATYPHLKVIREPDAGQADAINKGFAVATGSIFGFVNSDDTLAPGALAAVAEALREGTGRQIVMGRCRFIDEHDTFLGVEHPSAFESHRRVLEIWKGHCLPQPATFWTRDVWERCGPLNVDERLMLDYDLFCRFSRKYRFHCLDRVLANYRLHTDSKTQSINDRERLEQAIVVSRRYWGPIWSAQYWQILASYSRFRLDRRARAVQWMRSGRDLKRGGSQISGLARLAAGAALAPDVAADMALPVLRPTIAKIRGQLRAGRRGVTPQTAAWLSHHALYGDGWAGPDIVVELTVGAGDEVLTLVADTPPGRLSKPLAVEAFVDGRSLGRKAVGKKPQFSLAWPVRGLTAGSHEFRLAANTFLVPNDHLGNQDHRPLSYRVHRLAVIPG